MLDFTIVVLTVVTMFFVRAGDRGPVNAGLLCLMLAAWVAPMLFFGVRAIVVWVATLLVVGFIIVIMDFFSKPK